MSPATVGITHELEHLPGYEVQCEAEAGVSLTSGERWWGTRCRYRRTASRAWERILLVDVHPFDREAIGAALELVLAQRGDGAR